MDVNNEKMHNSWDDHAMRCFGAANIRAGISAGKHHKNLPREKSEEGSSTAFVNIVKKTQIILYIVCGNTY